MARSGRQHRFTVFDLMDEKGVFEANPANASSSQYVATGGPRQYPKMFYHPKGETRVTQAPEILVTPMGPKMTAEHREIINRLANNEDEAAALIRDGWHDHPAKAIAAGGGEPPPITSDQRIKDLEAEIARLTSERDSAKKPVPVVKVG